MNNSSLPRICRHALTLRNVLCGLAALVLICGAVSSFLPAPILTAPRALILIGMLLILAAVCQVVRALAPAFGGEPTQLSEFVSSLALAGGGLFVCVLGE